MRVETKTDHPVSVAPIAVTLATIHNQKGEKGHIPLENHEDSPPIKNLVKPGLYKLAK